MQTITQYRKVSSVKNLCADAMRYTGIQNALEKIDNFYTSEL